MELNKRVSSGRKVISLVLSVTFCATLDDGFVELLR
jgi:hypothetical protein